MICLLIFISLMETRITWGEGLSIEKLSPSDCPVDRSGGHFLNDWYEKIQPTVDNASSGLVVLCHKGSRLSEPWEWVSKHLPFMILESLILLHFLPWPYLGWIVKSQMNLAIPKLVLVIMFCDSNRVQSRRGQLSKKMKLLSFRDRETMLSSSEALMS